MPPSLAVDSEDTNKFDSSRIARSFLLCMFKSCTFLCEEENKLSFESGMIHKQHPLDEWIRKKKPVSRLCVASLRLFIAHISGCLTPSHEQSRHSATIVSFKAISAHFKLYDTRKKEPKNADFFHSFFFFLFHYFLLKSNSDYNSIPFHWDTVEMLPRHWAIACRAVGIAIVENHNLTTVQLIN